MDAVKKSKDRLHELEFEKSRIENELKKEKATCTREVIHQYTEIFLEQQAKGNMDKSTIHLYLSEMISEIKNIENR